MFVYVCVCVGCGVVERERERERDRERERERERTCSMARKSSKLPNKQAPYGRRHDSRDVREALKTRLRGKNCLFVIHQRWQSNSNLVS